MEKYQQYKDSGVSWLGTIPAHWEVRRLGSYFEERNTKVSDKDFEPLSVTKLGVFHQWENVAKSNDGDNRKLVKKGDFVINSRSDRKGSSGLSELDGSVSLINIVLKLRTDINGKYCHYLLKSHNFIEEFYRNGHGIVADLWTTRYDEMKMIKIAMPTADEQSAIVSYLDSATGEIDKAIAQQQDLINLLKERKSSIIQKYVIEGLNNHNFKESEQYWLGKIPSHWQLMKMQYMFDERKEKGYPDLPLLASTQHHGVIPQRMYENRVVEATKDLQNLKRVKVGDFVISLRSFQGGIEMAHYEGIISPAYTVLIPRNITAEYFKYFGKSHRFISLLKSTVTGIREGQNIDYSKLRESYLPIPPTKEQLEIAEFLDVQTSVIDKNLEFHNNLVELLKERKQIIINEAVTGKIKVI